MKYKFRHTEVYKGIKIDQKANTTKALMEKVQKKKKEIDGMHIDSNMPFKKYAMKWADVYKAPNVSLGRYKAIVRTINRISEAIGNKAMGKIKAIELQEYLNSLTDKTSGYIKDSYHIINAIFNRAYKDGLLARPIDVECPKGKKENIGRSLTDQEQEYLLRVLDGHRAELLCKLMLYCGLRSGEAAALQWKDIDFENGIIHVYRALKKDGTIGEPKTASGVRDIPIPQKFISTLKKSAGGPFSYVCTSESGGLCTETVRRNMWNNVKREINILMGCKVFRNQLVPPYPLQEPFKMHYLRHTYCTNLEKAGVPINIARVLMGHSSISVTAQIYTHADEKTIEIARKMINSV